MFRPDTAVTREAIAPHESHDTPRRRAGRLPRDPLRRTSRPGHGGPDRGVVVAGGGGARFGARHDGERPQDRALFVEIAGDDAGAAIRPSAFEREVVPTTAEIGGIAAELWREARSDDVASGLAVDLLAMRLTIALVRAPRPLEASLAARDGVDAAREHIERHFAERIDLAALSRVAHLSPFHLARAFRARVGTSPHRYLMDTRLAAAESLLRRGELTVTRVADRTGFASLAHLGRRFAERYGMSPSAYQRTFGRGDRTPG